MEKAWKKGMKTQEKQCFLPQNPWQSRLGSPEGPEGLGIGRSALANVGMLRGAAVAAVATGPSPGPSRWNPTPGTWRCYCRGAQR